MARFSAASVVDEDVDVFDLREVADDLAVDPGDGLELAGPVLGVVGPGDPGGGVRGPLGGHAVAAVAGSGSGLRGGTLPPLYFRTKVFHSGWLDQGYPGPHCRPGSVSFVAAFSIASG